MKYQYAFWGALLTLVCACGSGGPGAGSGAGPGAGSGAGPGAGPELCSNSSSDTAEQCTYGVIDRNMCHSIPVGYTKLADSRDAFIECIDEGVPNRIGRRNVAYDNLRRYSAEVLQINGYGRAFTFVAPALSEDYNGNGIRDAYDCLSASLRAHDLPDTARLTQFESIRSRACE